MASEKWEVGLKQEFPFLKYLPLVPAPPAPPASVPPFAAMMDRASAAKRRRKTQVAPTDPKLNGHHFSRAIHTATDGGSNQLP